VLQTIRSGGWGGRPHGDCASALLLRLPWRRAALAGQTSVSRRARQSYDQALAVATCFRRPGLHARRSASRPVTTSLECPGSRVTPPPRCTPLWQIAGGQMAPGFTQRHAQSRRGRIPPAMDPCAHWRRHIRAAWCRPAARRRGRSLARLARTRMLDVVESDTLRGASPNDYGVIHRSPSMRRNEAATRAAGAMRASPAPRTGYAMDEAGDLRRTRAHARRAAESAGTNGLVSISTASTTCFGSIPCSIISDLQGARSAFLFVVPQTG